MSTARRTQFPWLRYLLRTCVVFCLCLLLYVLSIGPMYWKWEEARLTGDNDALIVFYLPLMTAAEISPKFRSAINTYIDMWAYS